MKTLFKLTAFFAVFLILTQPIAFVFADEITEGDSAGGSTEETTPPPPLEESTDVPPPDETVDTTPPDTSDIDAPGTEGMTSVGSAVTEDKKNTADSKKLIPEVDNLTGALVYSYPIDVPPGRNGQTPSANLTYNSNNTSNDSIVGYGWSLDIPFIERSNTDGSETLFSDTNFISSISGELLHTTGTAYVAKIDDGSFISYTYDGTSWTVVEKNGTILSFGLSAATRQDDPSDSSHVSKWMLQSMTDTNGNFITYEYYKDAGQIYPSKVTYTNTSGGTGIFEVDFDRESRSDTVKTRNNGFAVTTNYRINTITAKVSGNIVRQYALSYSAGSNTGRSLLHSVTETAKTESGSSQTLNPSTFDYQSVGNDFVLTTTWTMPTRTCDGGVWTCGVALGAYVEGKSGQLLDVNADGLPDVVGMYDGSIDDTSGLHAVYLNTGSAFALAADWTMPTRECYPHLCGFPIGQDDSYRTGTFADVNGDELPDFIAAFKGDFTSVADTHVVWLNTGHSFEVDTGWTMPTYTCGAATCGIPLGSDVEDSGRSGSLTDVNGDGLVDFVATTTSNIVGLASSNAVWLNTGSGWSYASSWTMPTHACAAGDVETCGVPLGPTATKYNGALADVNGDLLPDFIATYSGSVTNATSTALHSVWLNTGSAFAISTSWTMPIHGCTTENCGYMLGADTAANRTAQLADVNGDGLPDYIITTNVNLSGVDPQVDSVYLNTGSSWVYDANWSMPTHTCGYLQTCGLELGATSDYRDGALVDVNADGLPDFVETLNNDLSDATDGNADGKGNVVYINTGTDFVIDDDWQMPTRECGMHYCGLALGTNADNRNGTLSDVNADGLPDFMATLNAHTNFEAPSHAMYLNTGKSADRLSSITLPSGGSIDAEYSYPRVGGRNTTSFVDYTMPVVASLTSDDGYSATDSTTTYAYANGEYHYFGINDPKKFAGFGIVTKTDGAGNVTKTYSHQGNSTDTANGEYDDQASKIGRPYRVEEYDNASHLYRLTVNKWDRYNIGTDHDFIKLARTTTLAYDGDVDHKDTSTEYTYDNTTGNMLTQTDWGEVTASTDGSFTDTGSDKSTDTITYASNPTAYIIGLPSNDTLTDQSSGKVREDKYFYDGLSSGSVNKGNLTKDQKWVTGTTYQTWKKSYNTNGTVATTTDPRNKVTTYTSYDTYNLYPTTITDPLSHAMSYLYDYSSGKQTQVTDQNSFVSQVILDGLDRPLTEKIPDPTSGTVTTKTTYTYSDLTFPQSVSSSNYLDATTTRDVISYSDGFGRKIQTRTEMEDSGNYAVKDTVYDARGLVQKESLPYTGTGTSNTAPTTTTSLYTSYTYDALKRPLAITNNLGSTSNVYDQWTTTTTDPDTYVKDYVNDVRGNLTTVVEHNSTSTYTTSYEWNLNGLLTKITDSLSNIRNFTYDGIGERLNAEDLHASGDATFGSWTYQYDNSGNLSQSVSPNGDTVQYTYDDINRPTIENWTGGTGNEVTYAYDSCSNGVGYLCTATVLGGVVSTYTYAPTGKVKNDVKTISGTGYTTGTSYDLQGNPVQITLPDTSKIKYLYNNAGLTESVQRKEVGGSYTNILSDIDYAPTDQITYLAYTNGVTTTNTYDATKLYRLTSKVTAKSGGSTFQSIAYTYDPVGNITNLTESATNNAKRVVNYTYDNLHRMLSATATQNGNPLYTHTLTYNSIGNILTKSDVGGTYVYNGSAGSSYANPHASTKINGVNRTYDHNGNTLTNGTNTNTWDYKNELIQVVGASTTNYTYDHSGERMSVTNGGITTVYPNKFYDYNGTKKNKNIYLGEDLIATIEDNAGTITPHYVHADHLNGSSVVTSSTGTQDELLDYYPFGEARIDDKAGTFEQKRKFTGYVHDSTGYEYAGARYQAAKSGRFISEDKMFWNLTNVELMDPQRQNSYSYARNNPLAYKDPDGNTPEFINQLNTQVSQIVQSINNFLANSFVPMASLNNNNTSVTNTQPQPTQQSTQKTTTWDPVTDQRIKTLDSRLQQPATNFVNSVESELNVQLRVVQGYRSSEEQNKLYAQGRTEPGNIVTNAKGGESYHNYGLAIDMVKMQKGKPNWNSPITSDIAKIAAIQGFTWGGTWQNLKDYPHFQMTFGQSISSLNVK